MQKQILLKNEESRIQKKLRDEVLQSSSPPPALPPKLSNSSSLKPSIVSKSSSQGDNEKRNSHPNNAPKRRVSISTDAVEIIGQSSSDEVFEEDAIVKGNHGKQEKRDLDQDSTLERISNESSVQKVKEYQGRMSVPDLIPSHELNDVVCMQNQVKEATKTNVKKYNLPLEQKKSKDRSMYGSNKDLQDLTEKGLPSVKDLVNRFLPNRTRSVDLVQNPEPAPRQSLPQKVIKIIY